jgi:hypothetical protein
VRVQFLEEAYVFDRNDRLVGKGLEQLDLVVWKHSSFKPSDSDCSDRLVLT